LVVEKEAVFQQLVANPVLGNVLLITGKGYPDVATRVLTRRVSQELKIPVCVPSFSSFRH
jgi:meiotic recombination protein SPO11